MMNKVILMTALMMGSVMAGPNAVGNWLPWSKSQSAVKPKDAPVAPQQQETPKELIDRWIRLSDQRTAFDGSGRSIDESKLTDLEPQITEKLKVHIGLADYWKHHKFIGDLKEKMYLWVRYEKDAQSMRMKGVSPDAIMLVKRSANVLKREIEDAVGNSQQLQDLWQEAQSQAKPVRVAPRNPALDSFKAPEPEAPHIQAAQIRCDAARAKLRDFMRYRVAGQPMTQDEKDQFDALEQNQRECDQDLHSMKNQDPIWP